MAYSENVKRILALAEEEARRFNNNFVGTEHLLLGVLKDKTNLATKILKGADISLQMIRQETERKVTKGRTAVQGEIGMTHLACRTLESAQAEANSLGSSDADGEHILLALLGNEHGVARKVLTGFRISREILFEALTADTTKESTDQEQPGQNERPGGGG